MGKNKNQIATLGDIESFYKSPHFTGTDLRGSNKCLIWQRLLDSHDKGLIRGTNDAYVSGKTLNKCVKWDDIMANHNATIPIYCSITEHVTGKTQASTIIFYYNYKTSGSSTWNSVETGRMELGSGGKVDGSASGVCYVKVNPSVSGTVTDDYLTVWCGTTGASRRYSCSYTTTTDTDYHYTTDISGKSVTYQPRYGTSGRRYAPALAWTYGIYFTIN